VIFGLAPSLRGARTDLEQAVKDGACAGKGRRGRRLNGDLGFEPESVLRAALRSRLRLMGSAADEPGQKGGRLLLHLGPGVRQAIEGDEVYYVEARADDTEVRTRGARVLRDVRRWACSRRRFFGMGSCASTATT
jgi:hypothetical protein